MGDKQNGTPRHIAEDCPCLNTRCKLHGDCVKCVAVHREHKQHLPECMENILRDPIRELAALVEYRVEDTRPKPK